MEDLIEQVQIWFHQPGEETCNRADHATHYQHSVLRVGVAQQGPHTPYDAVVMMVPIDSSITNGAVIRFTPESAVEVAMSLMARAWLVRRHTPATD